MKEWMDKIIDAIKTNQLTIMYIVMAALALTVIILSIVIAVLRRKEPVSYAKEDFVHKMLLTDVGVKRQLTAFGAIGCAIAFIALFFTKNVLAASICGYVAIGLGFINVWLKAIQKFNRVEYNMKDLYQFRFLCGATHFGWEDIKDVYAKGIGNKRKLVFVSKKGNKITVNLNAMGGYEFSVFAEKQLKGKNFEAVKIAKGRQM